MITMGVRQKGAEIGSLWIIHIESGDYISGSKTTKYSKVTKNHLCGQRICLQHVTDS